MAELLDASLGPTLDQVMATLCPFVRTNEDGSFVAPKDEALSDLLTLAASMAKSLASRSSAIVEEPMAVAADESIDHHAYRVAHIPEPSRSPQPHTGRAGVTDEMINAALNEKYGEVSIWSQLRVGVRSPFEIMRAALNAALTVEPAHPDDAAVDRFAAAMKAKLAKKRAEGRGGWERKDECTAEFLSELLRGHVKKGDPLDVGNLAMMLHQRGERILTVEPEAGEVTK